jgi:hypothetical protein
MRSNPPPNFDWPEPWQAISDEATASSLLAELHIEVGQDQRLFQRAVKAVARHNDCDDALFLANDPAWPPIAVHLTWRGSREPDPALPSTAFFSGWEDWKQRSHKG